MFNKDMTKLKNKTKSKSTKTKTKNITEGINGSKWTEAETLDMKWDRQNGEKPAVGENKENVKKNSVNSVRQGYLIEITHQIFKFMVSMKKKRKVGSKNFITL